jgi:hypothetical protein
MHKPDISAGILHPKRYKERTTSVTSPLARPLPSDRLSSARRQIDQFAAALGYAAWNCSASVEPDRATVSAFGEIAEVTLSKYPVPTSRWWRVAV